MIASPPLIQLWPIDRLVLYARNPRKNDAVVDRMCSSISEFGFKVPVLARSDGEVVDGHLRIKAARKLGIDQIPVILCDEWTPAQVKAFRLLVNRSVTWAAWDEELLALELQELSEADFDLDLIGFNPGEIDGLLAIPDEERANATPPVPENPVSLPGDLWLCGPHRVLCADSTSADAVTGLLGDRKPLLMVTDPPYGIELDSEWRDRAGLNGGDFGSKRTKASRARATADPQYHAEPSYLKHRTVGHTETTISGDTKADWSEAFELVPSLQIAYVWHASRFTREVLDGLLRIGFLHHQQIIWDKQRTVLTRTLYWFQHEPCWFVRNNRDLDYPPTNRKKRDSRLELSSRAVCKQYPRLQEALANYMTAPGDQLIYPSARLVVDIMDAAGGHSEGEVIACLRYLRQERGLRLGTKLGPRHFSWFKTVVADYFSQKRDRDLARSATSNRQAADVGIP